MHITLTRDYTVRADTSLLGYQGETNSRKITFSGLVVKGCDLYKLQILYSDGKVYELPVQDEAVTITGSILREIGYVSCQLLGYSVEGEEYTIVFKSNIFELEIKEAIEGDVAPIPPYEESVSALEKVLAHVDNAKEYAERAEAAADRAESAEADIAGVVEAATVAANKAKEYADDASRYSNAAKGYAETAQTSSESASASASAASVSEESAKAAALAAEEYSAKADKSSADAREYAESASSYANAASAYKDSASGYAASAKSYNDLAQEAANEAQQAEINAESHATAAENSANAAKLSETAVAEAKTAVEESQTIVEELSTEVAANTTKTLEARDEAVAARDTCIDIKDALTGYDSPLFVKPTAEGRSIVVEDSAAEPVYGLNIYGKSTQTRYNGYNLINTYAYSRDDGATVSIAADGTITVTNHTGYDLSGVSFVLTDAVPDGEYTFSLAAGAAMYVVLTVGDYTHQVTAGSKYTFTKSGYLRLQGVNVGAGSSVKFKGMLESGSTAHSYEPYVGGVPSPNPDYPQSISDIKDVVITVARRNLLARLEGFGQATVIANEDGSYTIKGGATSDYPQFVIPNAYGDYTLSIEQDSTTGHTVYLQNDPNDYTKPMTSITGKVTKTCTGYLRVLISVFTTADCTIRIMLEKGSVAHPFQKYEAQTAVAMRTLRGVPVSSGGNYTDSNGQEWVCDTLVVRNDGYGVLIENTAVATYSSEDTWTMSQLHRYTTPVKAGRQTSDSSILCNYGVPVSWRFGDENKADGACVMYSVRIYDGLTQRFGGSLDNFLSWLEGKTITVVSPRVNPATYELSPSQVEQLLALNTYYPVTTVYNDKGAEMGITYIADTKNYIDNKFSELSAAIVSSASEEE